MITLAIDAGQSIVGIYSIEKRKYRAYRDNTIAMAIKTRRLSPWHKVVHSFRWRAQDRAPHGKV